MNIKIKDLGALQVDDGTIPAISVDEEMEKISEWITQNKSASRAFGIGVIARSACFVFSLKKDEEILVFYLPIPQAREELEKGISWLLGVVQVGMVSIFSGGEQILIDGLSNTAKEFLKNQILVGLDKKVDENDEKMFS